MSDKMINFHCFFLTHESEGFTACLTGLRYIDFFTPDCVCVARYDLETADFKGMPDLTNDLRVKFLSFISDLSTNIDVI